MATRTHKAFYSPPEILTPVMKSQVQAGHAAAGVGDKLVPALQYAPRESWSIEESVMQAGLPTSQFSSRMISPPISGLWQDEGLFLSWKKAYLCIGCSFFDWNELDHLRQDTSQISPEVTCVKSNQKENEGWDRPYNAFITANSHIISLGFQLLHKATGRSHLETWTKLPPICR